MPRRGGKARGGKGPPANRILVGLPDKHTWAVAPDERVLHMVAHKVPRLPLVGVRESRIAEPPYNMLPIAFQPCVQAEHNGMLHIRLLEAAGFLPERIHKPMPPCGHAAEEATNGNAGNNGEAGSSAGASGNAIVGGICSDCQPMYIRANAPLDGVWYPSEMAVECGVLPKAAIPHAAWPLFRVSVPRHDPWNDLMGMAAAGHLASVSDTAVDYHVLHSLPPEQLEALAACSLLHPGAAACALWRLFGTLELESHAAPNEMALVQAVVSSPGSVFELAGRSVRRKEWTAFADLLLDQRVAREKPRNATVEYKSVSNSFGLSHAAAALQNEGADGLGWVHIAQATDISLAQLDDMIRQAGCRVALTFADNVRHEARYIQFKAAAP